MTATDFGCVRPPIEFKPLHADSMFSTEALETSVTGHMDGTLMSGRSKNQSREGW